MNLFVVKLPCRKDQIAAQREYKKKKNEKKRLRVKQLEEQKEKEKHQWLAFNAKVRAVQYGHITNYDIFFMYLRIYARVSGELSLWCTIVGYFDHDQCTLVLSAGCTVKYMRTS